MNTAERVVFDCNVYFQALIGPTGPAGECLQAAKKGKLSLYASRIVLAELRDVCLRPPVANRFRITTERLDEYIAEIESAATLVDEIPHVFDYRRDPSDAHYVDLAVACQAKLIVSRDRDLLALEDPATPEGQSFKRRFPELEILLPEQLLERLRRG
jgi:putative PIN family toxin of toxin-antitoxin system